MVSRVQEDDAPLLGALGQSFWHSRRTISAGTADTTLRFCTYVSSSCVGYEQSSNRALIWFHTSRGPACVHHSVFCSFARRGRPYLFEFRVYSGGPPYLFRSGQQTISTHRKDLLPISCIREETACLTFSSVTIVGCTLRRSLTL